MQGIFISNKDDIKWFSYKRLLGVWFSHSILHLMPIKLEPMQLLNSNNLGRPSGSSRRAAVSSSREAFIESESDPNHSRTTDASPGAAHRISSGQRILPVGSSDPRRTSSGRNTARNHENALRGIETLQLDNWGESVQYLGALFVNDGY